MWLTTIVLILVALALCVASAFIYGASRWQGKTKDFRARLDAVRRIPLEGEVAWKLPAGLFPYCRVRIREISYEFAR